MDQSDGSPVLPPVYAFDGTITVAPADHPCAICFCTGDVRWMRIPVRWDDPSTNLARATSWRLAAMCQTCARPDGGLVTTTSRNGTLVYRLGTGTPWPGRLVIVYGTLETH